YASMPLSRDYVYINAHSGKPERIQTRLMTIDVPGSVNTKYSGTQTITSETFNGGYRLRETDRGNGIITYDMQNSTNHNQAVDFFSSSPGWDSLSTSDQYALDAHYAAEMFYDYNFLVQGRNSLDDSGFVLKSYIHYDNAMTNAFWDGQGASFGDGSGNFSPLVSMDIVAHEFAHGLTEHTAGLGSSGEPYALNESFSDIVAVMVEKFAHPSVSDSLLFLVGEQVTNGGIRNMADPHSKNQADTYLGTNWSSSDPYACGAVQSHWFYLLSTGGSGINDNNDTFNLTGIGFNHAADIAYRTLTVYLTPNSDFADARFYSIQAAKDIFGGCSKELKQTTNAWHAVGVGDFWRDSLVVDFSWEKIPCSNPTAVKFSNQSSGLASCIWDFGDGTIDTLINPIHVYTKNGSYSPSISVTGCDGSYDQMFFPESIIIDNNSICDSNDIPSNSTTVVNSCEGMLFDSGGKDTNYGSGNTGSITLQGNTNDIIKLDFIKFDLGPYTDQIQIFDGPSTASPLIYTFNFMNAPSGPVFSSGDAITIKESYDGFMESSGFEAYYKCQTTSGIDKNDEPLQISMYPNPTSDIVYFNGHFDQISIEIYNMTGKIMISEKDINGSEFNLNVKGLSPGLYLVKIWNREVNDTFRLIIQ
ncbi:MAG: M4 family metallopeptidase, partial [Bacteroidales bacterium]|nr:M4 family metallopeptidase [Bacteroidales bacterium]